MKKVAIAFLTVFFLLASAALTLQSPWGKRKTMELLTNALKQSGWTLQVDEIHGALPYHVAMKGVHLRSPDFSLTIDSLETRLSLFRLLAREIAFSSIHGDTVSWTTSEGKTFSPVQQGLPFLLNIEQFQLTRVQIPDRFTADFEGNLRVGKKMRHALFNVTARRTDDPTTSAHLLFSIQRSGTALAHLKLKIPSLDVLNVHTPIDGVLSLEMTARGPWTAFVKGEGKIAATTSGTFYPTLLPPHLRDWFERVWSFSGKFTRNEDHSWTVSRVSSTSHFFTVKGTGSITPSGEIDIAHLQIFSDHLPSLSGRLFASLDVQKESEGWRVQAAGRMPKLDIGSAVASEVQGVGIGHFEKGVLQGDVTLTGDYLAQKWEAKTPFRWANRDGWSFPEYRIHTEGVEIKGTLAVRPDALLIGITQWNAAQLHPFTASLYGKGAGNIEWFVKEGMQGAHVDVRVFDFYWQTLSAQELFFYSDLTEPFTTPHGNISFGMARAKWGSSTFDSINLETSSVQEDWPFQIGIDGKWKHPLTLQLDGIAKIQNRELWISLQKMEGAFFKHPLVLMEPTHMEWSTLRSRVSDLKIRIADGTLALSLNRLDSDLDAHLKATQIPLDVLSLNPLDVPVVTGVLNCDAALHEKGHQLTGDFKASVQHMELADMGQKAPLGASGHLEGIFDRDRLNLKGDLTVRQAPLLDLNVSLPMHLEIWPWDFQLLKDQRVKGHVALNGKIEDFLDFADLGTHRLEGECHTDLTLLNTLDHPILEGTCTFKNGLYQNYFTGTEFKNIDAEWRATQDVLSLKMLTAQDAPGKGTLTATGQILLSPDEQFPYRFNIAFNALNFVAIDLVTAEATGNLVLEGTRERGLATGNIEVIETDVTIPSRIPRKLPDLQVVYKHATQPPAVPAPQTKAPYPLFLDLDVDAPSGILIAGRGLNSEWQGHFHIGGTQTALIAEGQIELIKGEFLFAGRKFKLTEGALSLSGHENEMPFLNLAATMDVKDVNIIARLKGPLNNPQITLQSTPPLSMGAIMSYLLFGHDMSEINSLQALQLANSLASLAGEGPDVLETTRRSLGVDRLQIITVPNPSEEGEETIAVQVGKYVTEDVLVSFSQGAEDSSSNISIEVELRGGFSFVLESDQPQEQGKFTLKWAKNY